MDAAGFAALLSAEGRALMDRLPPYDAARALALSARLRAEGVAEGTVAAALTQSRLRARAADRLGPDAARMWFTPDGLEQASRAVVARHRSRRYDVLGPGDVADLCCGIGGDLVHLAGSGRRVVAVDRDPLTCAVATANAEALGLADRVEVRCADVTAFDPAGMAAVFVDPARRDGSGRRRSPESWSPPYSFVRGLAARVPTGAKVAPGIPHADLPGDAEAEWVSVEGDVVECALWWGALRGEREVRRRATLLPSGATVTGDGTRRGGVGPVGRYLHEPDGAVIRAGLVAEVAELLAGRLLDPTIAYVAADDATGSPFTTTYAVLDVLPFGVKRLRSYLRERAVGTLTVKKRGSAVTQEALRSQLRLRGDTAATVVLTRVAGEQTVLVVEPV